MKKILLTTLIASMLIVPLGNTALAGHEEDALPVSAQDFVPGDAPAGNAAPEAMLPAVHGLILAMLNHDVKHFDLENSSLTWEGLYNMLSLYGQMDTRSVTEQGELFLPEETVRDYTSALALSFEELGAPPAAIRDRLNYDNVSHSYVVVCGEDGLAQVRVESFKPSAGGYTLTGSLVYQVDGRILAGFRAELRPQDNMFGYAVTAVSIAG